jgi:hypothetical protein
LVSLVFEFEVMAVNHHVSPPVGGPFTVVVPMEFSSNLLGPKKIWTVAMMTPLH